MLVSVIIPSYNSQATIQQCLDSLLNQECAQHLFEIIVVDSSEDETGDIIKMRFPTIKLLKLDRRTYQGAALNLGIQQAKGDIVAFMDADCIAAKDWIKQIIFAHKSPESVICGSIMNGQPNSLVSWAEYFVAASEFFEGSKRRFVKVAPGGNTSCKRKAFPRLGWYANIPRGEDLLFSGNLCEKNIPILLEPKIRVSHLYRTQLRDVLGREVRSGKTMHKLAKHSKFKGGFVIKNRMLALAFPIIKLLLIGTRIIRWNRKRFFLFLKALPLVLLMLLANTYGMVTANSFAEGFVARAAR